ncbi:MAG: rRNA adenine N-6-methyltransferase family protein [Saprospiraceae bacterium]
MSNLLFIKEGFKKFKSIGSISKSSRFVAKEMLKNINFNEKIVIVELGAGTGAITKFLMEKMNEESKLIIIESNEAFCRKLQVGLDHRVILIQDSAEHIEDHIKNLNLGMVDYVVSSLPFVMFNEHLCIRILNSVSRVMKPDALLIQLHYSLWIKKIYEKIFCKIKINFVPVNIPPAFIFICSKNKV